VGAHQQRLQVVGPARQPQDQVDPLALALIEAVLVDRAQSREGISHVAAHGQQPEPVPVDMAGAGDGLEVLQQLGVGGAGRTHGWSAARVQR